MREADGRRMHSRAFGPHSIMAELRRLIIKNHRSLTIRAESHEEQVWSRRVHDELLALVHEGQDVLPPPRARTPRCRPGHLF